MNTVKIKRKDSNNGNTGIGKALAIDRFMFRYSWRYSEKYRAVESQRKRLNSCASMLALLYDGAIIHHPADIKRDSVYSVTVSKLANTVFLNGLQEDLRLS